MGNAGFQYAKKLSKVSNLSKISAIIKKIKEVFNVKKNLSITIRFYIIFVNEFFSIIQTIYDLWIL